MLPFHRRREPRMKEKHATTGDSKGKKLWSFFIDWVKVSWKDVLAMAILGAAQQAIYSTPVAGIRNFPITFNASGDIVYPEWAYPNRGWIISPMQSGIISSVIPIGIFLVAQIRIRSFWDANNAIMGVLYSLILGTLFQVTTKQLIGGFRPYFLDACQPDISRAEGHNVTGLNAVGFHQVMYSIDVCTNPNTNEIKGAITSFPSGHSTAAFAGYIYLFLWLNAKLKVWANYQASFYWLALLFAPLLGAFLIAGSLTIDQAHNWYDIVAGSSIGTLTAFASYRATYAAVLDWRFNHIPLTRGRVMDYAAWATPEYMQRAVFVRKLGWGRVSRRRGRREGALEKRASRGIGSARSSATYGHHGSGASPMSHGVRAPETTRVGTHPHTNGRLPGDQMV